MSTDLVGHGVAVVVDIDDAVGGGGVVIGSGVVTVGVISFLVC